MADRFPGATLGPALAAPVGLAGGGKDLYIQQDKFGAQFAADVPAKDSRLHAATQRPIAEAAGAEPSGAPAWKSVPSWHIYGDADKNIPPAAMKFMAERAGAKEAVVLTGASHVTMLSQPKAVAAIIKRAAAGAARERARKRSCAARRASTRQPRSARRRARDIAGALKLLLADLFALYLKTKNFHWHVSGPHFRDYHLLLDEQAEQIFATTDPLAERVRKVGGTTLRSIGHIARLQRVLDNDADYVSPLDMLAELREDNLQLAARMRATHGVCDEHGDVVTASLLEVWIDEAEKRVWFLFEASRKGDEPGR